MTITLTGHTGSEKSELSIFNDLLSKLSRLHGGMPRSTPECFALRGYEPSQLKDLVAAIGARTEILLKICSFTAYIS